MKRRSFVSQGGDGVAAGSSQGGVSGSRESADDGDENGAKNPVRSDFNLQGWRRSVQQRSERVCSEQTEGDANRHEQKRFTQNETADFDARQAQGFEDGNFTAAFEHERVHRQENDEEADGYAKSNKGPDERLELR